MSTAVTSRPDRPNWPRVTFPHPPGRKPVVGDLWTMMRQPEPTPVQNMLRISAPLGPIYEVKLFSRKLVLVREAALAAELCDEKRFEKKLAPGVAALRGMAGDGLFTAYSDEPNWQLAHDLLRPAFTRPAMQGYHDTMTAVATELLAKWSGGADHDVSADLTRMTLETIGRTSFSKDFGSFRHEELDPFVAAMIAALRQGQRTATFSAMPGSALILRRGRRKLHEHRGYLDTMIDQIIDARIASGDTSRRDLLGLMLNAAAEDGSQLDRTNIRFQILTFLVAGHETTSGALSFTLYYLATHPEVARRARAEADQILGADTGAMPTFEQVAKFRYIRRVLDESLRLWPTAPGFARGPRETTVIGGRYLMTPDDYCIVLAPAVHRDRAVWGPDADSFDPDRFSPDQVRKRPAHTYFPFGTGERACIGRQFALHEAVLVLATLCHRFDFTADPAYELQITERLTLMPKDFRLTFRSRIPAPAAAPASA